MDDGCFGCFALLCFAMFCYVCFASLCYALPLTVDWMWCVEDGWYSSIRSSCAIVAYHKGSSHRDLSLRSVDPLGRGSRSVARPRTVLYSSSCAGSFESARSDLTTATTNLVVGGDETIKRQEARSSTGPFPFPFSPLPKPKPRPQTRAGVRVAMNHEPSFLFLWLLRRPDSQPDLHGPSALALHQGRRGIADRLSGALQAPVEVWSS